MYIRTQCALAVGVSGLMRIIMRRFSFFFIPSSENTPTLLFLASFFFPCLSLPSSSCAIAIPVFPLLSFSQNKRKIKTTGGSAKKECKQDVSFFFFSFSREKEYSCYGKQQRKREKREKDGMNTDAVLSSPHRIPLKVDTKYMSCYNIFVI